MSPFEHFALAGVDRQQQLRRGGGARVEPPGGIKAHRSLVGHDGVSIASQSTKQIALTVGPPGLIRLAFLHQLVEIECFVEPFGSERLDEVAMKIRDLAVAFAQLPAWDKML